MIVVKFDPNTNYVKRFDVSGEAVPDATTIVFHDQNTGPSVLNNLFNLAAQVPLRYMIVDQGVPREMTPAEKSVVDAADLAATTLAIREAAKAIIDGFNRESLFQRAALDIIREEFNIVRKWTRDFKVEVAAATNLSDLKTRVATLPTLADRTLTQLRSALKARADDGSVDS